MLTLWYGDVFEHKDTTQKDFCDTHFSGQSYKASTIIIYASRVVPDLKLPHITTLES